jgi:hypothetical protein
MNETPAVALCRELHREQLEPRSDDIALLEANEVEEYKKEILDQR